MRRIFRALLPAAALAALAAGWPPARPTPAPASQAVVADAWDSVLRSYVDGEGLVDYARLQRDGKAELEAYMQLQAAAEPSGFANDAEKIAYWINAYNSVVIWQVVERYPLESVRDVGHLWGLVGGFFKQQYPVAGRQMSADDIEHDTLRAGFDDERIHWVLVCAAFGCPRLLDRAYRAESLDETLRAQSFEFLAEPRGLQIDREAGTLWLSSYFDWYAGDFEKVAPSVIEYVLRYAPAEAAAWIRDHRDSMTVRFMEYDWALNSQQNGPRSRRPVPR